MTHAHHSDVEVIDNGGGTAVSGLLLAIAALLILAMVAFAVIWTHPWGGTSTNTNSRPAISDNSGGGQSGGGNQSSGGGQSSGGDQSGGGGSGGSQPAQ